MKERTATPANPANYMYVIYDNPPGHPGRVVVRIWSIEEIEPDVWGPVAGPAMLADSIEEARALIPEGFIRAGLNSGPDAKITEVYI